MNLETLSQRADIWRGGQTPPAITQTLPSGYDTLDGALNNGGWPVGELIELYSQLDGEHTNGRNNGRNRSQFDGQHANAGHLKLLMPALARLSHQTQRRWIAWVAPPYIPYAPALRRQGIDLNSILLIHPKAQRQPSADASVDATTDSNNERSNQTYDRESRRQQLKNQLWAAEQALASNTCSAVLMWIHGAKDRDLRRLHLAAQRGNTLGVLFPAPSAINNPSPASLRIVTRQVLKPKRHEQEHGHGDKERHEHETLISDSKLIKTGLEVELIKQRGAGARTTLHITDNHQHYRSVITKNNQLTMNFDLSQPDFGIHQTSNQYLNN